MASPAEPFWVLYAREHIDVEGESKKRDTGQAPVTRTKRREQPKKRRPRAKPKSFEFQRPKRSEASLEDNPRDYGIQAQIALRVEPPLLVRGPNLKSFVRALSSAVQLESEAALRIVRTQPHPFLVFISAASQEILNKIHQTVLNGRAGGHTSTISVVVGDEEKLISFHSFVKGANLRSSATQRRHRPASQTVKIISLSARARKLLTTAFKSCCRFYGDSDTLMADGVLQAMRRTHGGGVQLGHSTALPTMTSLRRWYRYAKVPHDSNLDLKKFLQVAAVAFSEAEHERRRLMNTSRSISHRIRSRDRSQTDSQRRAQSMTPKTRNGLKQGVFCV